MRCLSALLLIAVSPAFGQDNCDLRLDKDSIRVYTCPRSDSRYKTVKVSFMLEADLGELANAILDIEQYGRWQYKTQIIKLLKKVSEREIVYYTRVEAPVLTQDRDFIIRLTVDPDRMTRGLIVEAVSLPDYLPPVEDVVRVPYSRARWNIVPLGKRKLSIEYTIDIDLGGSVPAWAVNLVAPKAPYETFSALREIISDYRGKKVGFIPE